MYRPSWILTTALLTSGALAFYPLTPDATADSVSTAVQTSDSDSASRVKRFFPYLEEDDSVVPTTVPTVKLTKRRYTNARLHKIERASPVKRDNTYTILSATEPAKTDSIPLNEDANDYTYMATLNFGSDDTEMNMLVDTGSGTTWVMGDDCETTACSSHNTYGEEDSTSFVETSEEFSLAYGSGSVTGYVVNDTVKAGDLSVDLSFGWATNVSATFSNYPMDGIVALGRAASDKTSGPSFMEALNEAGLLKSYILGFHFQRASDDSDDGEMNFGVIDSTRFSGDLVYTDCESDSDLWEIPVDGASVGGSSIGITNRTAIIDTGTSYILLPPADAKTLHSKFTNATKSGSYWHIPCDSTENIQFTFSNVAFNVSSKDYLGSKTTDGLCTSKIIGQQAYGDTQWLLGDVFLKNVYTVFDYEKERIGFGSGDGSSKATSTATASASGAATATSSSSDSAQTSPSTHNDSTSASTQLVPNAFVVAMLLFISCVSLM